MAAILGREHVYDYLWLTAPCITRYHRIRALPHVIPAPIAIIAIRIAWLQRPPGVPPSFERIGSEALRTYRRERGEVQPTFFKRNSDFPSTDSTIRALGPDAETM